MSDTLPQPTPQNTIALLFDEQVARTPDAPAVVFGDTQLSYRQLDGEANRLARYLQSIDVGPESLVGVFMDRSLEMAIALWAILKAGGAYVPLDPTYPGARIAQMVEDSRSSVILTTERVRRFLPDVAARAISLDGEAATFAAQSQQPIAPCAKSTNLAYVIYTSGSTGTPKGVMVEHRNVTSFFAAMDCVLGTEAGTWLALTSICFDISVLELLWTLTRGFKVILHGEEGTHTIAAEIVRHQVTHLQSTPSLLRMVTTDPRSLAALRSVQSLLLGGEALPASLIRSLRPWITGTIYNMYGPTEATVWSTAYRIPDTADFPSIVPIGWPLANTTAYVLDSHLRPAPVGEAGELFLGGAGVVRGYWQRPELTAERFLPDPFSGVGCIYRTGDLVRTLPDGNIEFLGRTDFQVKLRGFRIELGEIEAALERHPAVQQGVVVARDFARDGQASDQRLVAYLVPKEGQSVMSHDLSAALEKQLPKYMVPSHFVVLDRLPLTANGKIDRGALPAVMSRSHPIPFAPSVAEGALGEIEQVLLQAWRTALGAEEVGVDENIFDLGATSLTVAEVQIELQRNLGREISLVDLFEFHTVRTLAAHLGGTSAAAQHVPQAERRRAARNRQ